MGAMRKLRISDAAELLNEGVEAGRAFLVYEVLGWKVEMTVSLAGPILNGPESVTVSPFGDAEGYEIASLTDGVTTGVLRALPLQDARKRLAKLQAAATEESVLDLPERLGSPLDWARFAAAYAAAAEAGDHSPILTLARRLGLPRNTVSARVRRARELGLITRPSKKSIGQLTARAERLLNESEAGESVEE